jgi:CheY-like chemotaxis protein
MTSPNKILVVEDNDFVRMQIVRFLGEEGHEVIESTDGEDALTKMNKDIALAIVDIRMEPIGGFEFVRHIRGMELTTPVILVTGDQNPDLLAEAGKWNIAAVLMKPVQRDRLVKTVSRTLQQRPRAS